MSSSTPAVVSVDPNTLITLKLLYNDNNRRFKVPLKDLGARVLPQKLRQLLGIPADVNVIFERYSDSAGCYVRLDTDNSAVYKQLYRAAKAKLKLRIRVIQLTEQPTPSQPEELPEPLAPTERCNYLETVLSSPLSTDQPMVGAPNPAHWCNPSTSYREFVPDNLTTPVVSHTSPTGIFCIDCNQCGRSIPNEHYHCSICENGDYDLCLPCVQSGATCLDDEHWLIKRVVTDGIVTNSTTETVAPRKARATEPEQKQTDLISEAPTPAPMAPPTSPAPYVAREAPAPAPADPTEERICNGCLREYDETKMVTCVDCEDYDLCTTCILNNTHGHHPAHTFTLIRDQEFSLKSRVLSRCKAGRNRQHSAICDGCEKRITGVRHKCLSCPDWDYCAECHQKAAQTHPGHRFVPLYGPIADPPQHREVHAGIYCDGPLCKDKPFPSYIIGVRYKCSICYDTDFCAKCEALPTNSHSRTHPMIMLKTPVQNVSVSTVQANPVGDSIRSFGDLPANPSPVQRTSPVESSKPSPRVNLPKPVVESPVVEATEKPAAPAPESPVKVAEKPADTTDASYRALFERDTVADGTAMPPNKVFEQTWTLYNPGPLAWPAGTFVRFVGGDSMFNVDTNTPLSLSSVNYATESNQLADPVQPGQRANFTVVLKAPSRVGTAISYWRLKLADGTPFGHRLWCDIRVREEVPPVEGESERSASETETAGSQMIFPKLEKESPAASTHEAATAAPAPSVTNSSDQDILEDVESLTLGDDDTEAGFLTDEEYDILDASDQEYMDARSVRN